MNMERLARGMRTGSPRKTAATAAKWRHDNFGKECVPVPTGTSFKFPSKRNEESFADDFHGHALVAACHRICIRPCWTAGTAIRARRIGCCFCLR